MLNLLNIFGNHASDAYARGRDEALRISFAGQ